MNPSAEQGRGDASAGKFSTRRDVAETDIIDANAREGLRIESLFACKAMFIV
jgi:hypothetical protein